jgi:hypothetical protein
LATPEEITYNESLRTLDIQREGVNTLHTRASTILAAAAIVTSFFGSAAIDSNNGELDTLSVFAALAFIGCAGCCIALLWPREWDWGFSAQGLVADYLDAQPPAGAEEMHRDLALHHEIDFDANEVRIRLMLRVFRGGSFLLALEVLIWLIDLRR